MTKKEREIIHEVFTKWLFRQGRGTHFRDTLNRKLNYQNKLDIINNYYNLDNFGKYLNIYLNYNGRVKHIKVEDKKLNDIYLSFRIEF